MSFLQWRRFNFFDKEVLKYPDRDGYFDGLKDINISSSACGKGFYIFGDYDGFLHFLMYDMDMQSMKVYDVKVTHLYQMTNYFYLISVGQDNASPNPVIKIWNLEKGFDKYGQIPCVRNIKITFGTKIPTVSCIVAHDNLSILLVGLSSGHILIYRGNFVRERNPSTTVKPKLFYQATSPITNLALAYTQKWERKKIPIPSGTSTNTLGSLITSRPSATSLQESPTVLPGPKSVPYTVLYVTTLDSVLSFTFKSDVCPTLSSTTAISTGKNNKPNPGSALVQPTILDADKGCAPACGTLMSLNHHHNDTMGVGESGKQAGSVSSNIVSGEEQYYVVARSEALYFYGPDCLGPCLAFESPKLAVTWLASSRYLVTIEDKPTLPFTSPPSLTHDHQNSQRSNAANILTIYDVENKFIAFSAPVPRIRKFFDQPCHLLSTIQDGAQNQTCPCPSYLILTQGIYLNNQADPKGKSQMLNNALLICREKSTKTKLEILFRKNFYDLALGLVRTRLSDLSSAGSETNGTRGGNSTGPSSIVSYIFKLYGDHLYARGDFENAINQYCKTIGGSAIESSYVIRKYLDASKIKLLSTYLESLHLYWANHSHGNCPKLTLLPHHTTLLINCYIKSGPQGEKLDKFLTCQLPRLPQGCVEQAIELLITRPEPGFQKTACELAKQHKLPAIYVKMEVEHNHNYGQTLKYITSLDFEEAEKAMKNYGPTFLANLPDQTLDVLVWLTCDYGRDRRSNPEDFIRLFVNDSELLTTFLERVIKARKPSDRCSVSVYDTLLELYLADLPHQASVDPVSKQRKEAQIREILTNPACNYNPDQAMILCQRFSLSYPLSVFCNKSKGSDINIDPRDISDYSITAEQLVNRLLSHTVGQVKNQANFWLKILTQFSASDLCDGGRKCNFVHKLLEFMVGPNGRIENVPSPMEIVKILGSTSGGTLPFSAVKDYLINHFEREKMEIETNEKLIAHYTEQIERTQEQIDNLLSKPRTFQVSKCSACGHALETPAIYFLCQHGFHQNCYDSFGSSYDYNFNVVATLKISQIDLGPGIVTDSRSSLIPSTNRSCCPVCFNSEEEWKIFRKFNQLKESRDANRAKYNENFHTQLERSCVWDGKSSLKPPIEGKLNENNMAKDAGRDDIECDNTFALLSKYLGQNVFEKIKLITDKDISIPQIQQSNKTLPNLLSDHKNPFAPSKKSTNPFPLY